MPAPTPDPNRPCLEMVRLGVCRFGTRCAFVESHSWDRAKLRKASACHAFRNRRECPRGKECKFLHLELPPDPCWQFVATGRCYRGSTCRYSHTKPSVPEPEPEKRRSKDKDKRPDTSNKESSRKPKYTRNPEQEDEDASDSKYHRERSTHRCNPSSQTNNKTKNNHKYAPPPYTPPTPDPPPPPPPPPRQVSRDSSIGTEAYQRGDYKQAIRSFTRALDGKDVQQGDRISLLSNRAHSYHRLYELERDNKFLDTILEDCLDVIKLAGSTGHFKCTILASKVHLYQLQFDEAMKLAKSAHGKTDGNVARLTAVLDLMDCITSGRIAEQRKLDLEEKRLREGREKNTAEARRVKALLAVFATMTPHEILELAPTATKCEIKLAYKKAALKYHPDKPGGGT
ncbi:uncharacterized protein EI90DRAFT_960707 [Cantharellus anzutake]|uniref:uncharacterized protein n=1 Tax=Cantharellus anzutake TaxID=1750568 RepID=UPI001905BAC4|nr:uncharacterized protein EI90DRAFT_960707 [Cantharellus anzutake]KAF8331679.1 hypothetical protein EI90DRAFT_960707 [Cantharellus anzutake]